jgi:hypothetical protein
MTTPPLSPTSQPPDMVNLLDSMEFLVIRVRNLKFIFCPILNGLLITGDISFYSLCPKKHVILKFKICLKKHVI